MKQRFSSLDVKVIAHELQESLVSLRLSNIYDLSSKILLIKFSKPDNKKQLIIDTGFRCHLTDFTRTTANTQSALVTHLRKYLKTRRLTKVSQIGTDRILELQFGDGYYRLFLEFFASGNLILTDADLKILVIARNVSEAEAQEPQKVGLQYSLENRQNYGGIPPLTKERITDGLSIAVKKAAGNTTGQGKSRAKPGADLRKSLATTITEVPPVLVEHCLSSGNFDLTTPLVDILESDALLDDLIKSLAKARKIAEDVTSNSTCTGYIFAKKKDSNRKDEVDAVQEETPKPSYLLYDDFHPFIPTALAQNPAIEVIEIESYNKTVDKFFSSLEGQKLESRLTEREAQAQRKLDHAKQEQTKRIEGLEQMKAVNQVKAAAIEANVDRVQEAMDAVNGLIEQGMDWVNIGKLIEREKKRSNPVAMIIKLPLNLEENMITLDLAEEDFEEEEEDDPFETDDEDLEDNDTLAGNDEPSPTKTLTVEINLGITPWANAREYYEQRRSAAAKQEKTELQAAKALKSTEKKISADLKKGLKQEKALLLPTRALMWFEKFLWFISSDGYLVLGGKDASQNEMLYRKHLRKGDVYCHADIRGASVVIIKNNLNTPDAPIPPATLSQAGNFSVCSSEAWDSKAGMGAWWVNAEQVSKTASTGDFLPLGSFNISGKKSFLPPTQLLVGLGFMFKISDESKAQHIKHRVIDEGEPVTANDNEATEEADFQRDDQDQQPDVTSDSDSGSVHDDGDEQRYNPLKPSAGVEEDDDVVETEQAISSMNLDEDEKENDDTKPSEESPQDIIPKTEEEEEEEEEEEDDIAESSIPSSTRTSTPAPSNTTTSTTKPVKRGQKSKAKKIANKYKHQDEEDRLAAEAVTGAALGKAKAQAEAKAKAQREADLQAAKDRRHAQHEKQQKVTAQHEQLRRAMMQQQQGSTAAAADDDSAITDISLDTIVGTPLPSDQILEIIPVCAPWTAMSKFKYKAKLQPGPMKKGKAVREILERIKSDSNKKGVVDMNGRDKEKMWPREVELIRGLKAEEIVNSVPVGKVRVMIAGGSGGGGGKGGGSSSGGGKGKQRGEKKAKK